MSKYKSGNTTIVLAIILVALLAVAGTMLTNKQSKQVANAEPAIENTSDLDQVKMELDSVNVDSMDTGLNEVGKDAAAI